MNKTRRRANFLRGMSAIMATLLALMIGAAAIVEANLSYVNARLGLNNYKIIDRAEGEKVDSIYFKSEFNSLEELVQAKNALGEELGAEGTVLLKNNQAALPVDISTERVTLWGLNSVNPTMAGKIGSSVSVTEDAGQVLYDLVTALTEKGFSLNQDMLSFYLREDINAEYGRKGGHSINPSFGKLYENGTTYCVGEAPASVYTDELLKSADGTVALVVISRDSSEAADYYPEMTSTGPSKKKANSDSFDRPLALSANERDVISMAKAHSSRVIVLLNCNNPVEIDELKQDEGIGAIVWCGEPGANAFLGLASVLSGAANPSGHLPDTFAVRPDLAPSMVNHGVYLYTNNSKNGTGDLMPADDKSDWYLVESEGIYIGYKYYETRYEDSVLGNGNADSTAGTAGGSWQWEHEVSYPFGYGLSYTTFRQELKSVEMHLGMPGTARVAVTNTGSLAGKSVVQLYVQTPYTQGGLEKAAIQLVAFEKTDLLQPGESQELTITFDPAYFASYDEQAVKADGTMGAWCFEAGDYYFSIGNGAHEALNNVLAKKLGTQAGLVMTAQTEEISPENAVLWTLQTTDIETYSTGVQNQLEAADINKLIPGTVEYTTRADWTKGWTPVEPITPVESMRKGLSNQIYTLHENGENVQWGVQNGLKLIDAVMTDENGAYLGVLPFEDDFWDRLVDQVTLDEAIYFIEKAGDDFEKIDSVHLDKVYCNDGPLGYTGDQVGGYFVRWVESDQQINPYYTPESNPYSSWRMATMPTEPLVAATWNKKLIEREGELLGEDGLYSKESALMGPGMNLHRSPYCARNHEYYSEDAMLTAYCGNAFCIGLKNKGTMGEPKHLAFNHQESNRSGLSTFFNEQAARENELRGFQLALSQNNARGVMSAFNRVGTEYSAGCRSLMVNILRNEWGFLGWCFTDMINGPDYMNWRDAVANGGGFMLASTVYANSAIGEMANSKALIEKDANFQQEMKQSLKHFLYTTAQSNAMNGVSATTETVFVRTWLQNALLGGEIALSVLTVLIVAAAVVYEKKSRKTMKMEG